MKDIQKFMAFTKKWEGGLSRHTSDSASKHPNPLTWDKKTGWHTNIGITYPVWKSFYGPKMDAEFFTMTEDQWFQIFKRLYWDKVRADELDSFAVAVYVTGMAWGSGAKRAGNILQAAINSFGFNLVRDGVIGPRTLDAANSIEERKLFDELLARREAFFRHICTPEGSKNWEKNKHNLKGWLRRLEDYRKTFRPE